MRSNCVLYRKDTIATFAKAALMRHIISKTADITPVVLDRMLPGKDGLMILREMRSSGDETPVLMLTALDTVKDRTDGLDAGGG